MAGRASPCSTSSISLTSSRHRTRRGCGAASASAPTPDARRPTPVRPCRPTTQIDWNGATPICTFVDSYDVVGNRTGRVKDGTACTWVYDSIYRLTEQQKSGQAATFTYDATGNILVKHHEGSNPYSFTYDAANRLVTSIQGTSQLTSFGYDANGNMTWEQCDTLGTLLTWVYDDENRMLNELRPSGANHTMTYHENGLRWSSQRGGSSQIVSYIWLEQDVLNTYLQTGLQARYDVVDGEILAEKRGGDRYLYVPDPLGSVTHLLNTSQTKVATYTFSPYGETVALTGLELPPQFVGNLGYHTLTTNRVYVRARWYRPDLGRWMTQDPVGLRGGDWNVHRYTRSQPVSQADPSGRRGISRRALAASEGWPPWPGVTPIDCDSADPCGWIDWTLSPELGCVTFCCNGSAVACVRPQPPCPDGGALVCRLPGVPWSGVPWRVLRACAVQHEDIHRRDMVDACKEHPCGLVPNPFPTMGDFRRSECTAYADTVACAAAGAAEACGPWQDCHDLLREQICEWCKRIHYLMCAMLQYADRPAACAGCPY